MPITISGDGGIAGVTNLDGGDFECATLVASGDTTLGPQAVGRASLFVDDSANSVGINTTTPAAAVFLEVADATDPIVSLNNTGNGEVRLGCTSSLGYLRTNSNHALALQTNAANAIYIDTNQRVGINTTSPSNFLQVGFCSNGSSLASGGGALSLARNGHTFLEFWTSGGTQQSNIIFNQAGSEAGRIQFVSDSLRAFIGGTEKVRLTSTPTLSIGDTTPPFAKVLNVQGSTGSILLLSSKDTATGAADTFAGIEFRGDSGNGGNVTSEIRGAKENGTVGNNASYISFHIRSNGAAMTEAARFNSAGNLAFPNGKGIDFSATVGPNPVSSVLDDYEEGTFTPTLRGSGTAGTYIAGRESVGRYVKVGRMVFVTADFNNGTFSGSSGSIKITNLPFTVASDGQSSSGDIPYASYAAAMMYGINFNASYRYSWYMGTGEAAAFGIISRPSTAWIDWPSSDFHSSNLYFTQSFVYMTT